MFNLTNMWASICEPHEHQFNQYRFWYGIAWNVHPTKPQKLILYLTRGKPYLANAKVFHWCFKLYFHKQELYIFSLTYYEYFCRKIELVSLFFHPGPQWIWRRKKELQLNQMKIMRIMNEWKSDGIIWCLHKRWKLLNFCSILCQRRSDRPIGWRWRWW